jgi:hypothetical protein
MFSEPSKCQLQPKPTLLSHSTGTRLQQLVPLESFAAYSVVFSLDRSIAKRLVHHLLSWFPHRGSPSNGTLYLIIKDVDITGQWIFTAAGPGEKYETPIGHIIKGESTLLDPDGRVLARWVKTRENQLSHGLVETLQSAFERFAGVAPLVPAPAHTENQLPPSIRSLIWMSACTRGAGRPAKPMMSR